MNPTAYRLWNIVLKLILVLLIGFGLFYSLPLIVAVGDGFGLILPFEILIGLAVIVAILIYPALYFTMKTWLETHIKNFIGLKKNSYIIFGFLCYLFIIWSLIWTFTIVYTDARTQVITKKCAAHPKEYWLTLQGTSGIANDCIKLFYP